MNNRQEKIIFACAIRDCEKHIISVYNNILNLAKLFAEYRIIFIESDSKDSTLQFLANLKENDKNVEFISLGNLSSKFEERTERIAAARNTYLDLVESNYPTWDILCPFDADDRSTYPIDINDFLSNFKYSGWDMICANQKNKYYDMWALRHYYWMPFDVIRWMTLERPYFIKYKDAQNMCSHSRIIHIDEMYPPIKVDSAFGGMALIKISSIKGARHKGLYEDGWPCCEWVPFCKSLNGGNAKIYINPKFINGLGDT